MLDAVDFAVAHSRGLADTLAAMLGAMDLQWLGWLGAILGAVLAVWGFVGVRKRPGHCRRCCHPIPPSIQTPGGVCLECGYAFRRVKDTIHNQASITKGLFGLVIALGGIAFGLGDRGRMRVMQVLTPPYKAISTQSWGGVSVVIREARWPQLEPDRQELVEVLIEGERAWRVELENPTAGTLEPPVGRGFPERLWIREQTSGSGGFSTTYVFDVSLGQLRPLLVLDNGAFEGATWLQPDFSYRYWITSGADSPVPYLRGQIRTDRLVFIDPAADAAPSQTRLDGLVESIRGLEPSATSSGSILGASLRGFLDLLYAGKAPQAWAFLDRCHDAGLARLLASGAVSDLPRSREAFRSALLHKVSESPYYDDVLRFNGGSIEPPER
jgi:hypothetical protein